MYNDRDLYLQAQVIEGIGGTSTRTEAHMGRVAHGVILLEL